MQQMQSKKQLGTQLRIESGTHIEQKQSFIQLFKFVQQSEMVNLTKEAVEKLGFSCGLKQNCNTIIQMGGIQLFTKLLKHPNPDIVFGAMYGIGNIGVYYSESLNLTQIIASIMEAVQRHPNVQRIRQPSVWCLINSINLQVTQQYEMIRNGVQFICKQIAQESIKDHDNIQNCLIIIKKCCFRNQLTIKNLIGSQIVPAVFRLVSHQNQRIQLKSHQLICFLSRGNSDQTQHLIRNGLIEVMERSLFSSSINIRASSCLILSNVFAQKSFIVQPLIQNQRLISTILSLFENDDDMIRIQISFIFSNMTLNGYPPYLLALFQDTKIITYYIELFISIEKTNQETRIQMLLECMIRIIEFIKKYSEIYGRRSYFYLLNQINALDIASRLRKYEDRDIQKNLIKLSTLKNEKQDLEKQLVEDLTLLY